MGLFQNNNSIQWTSAWTYKLNGSNVVKETWFCKGTSADNGRYTQSPLQNLWVVDPYISNKTEVPDMGHVLFEGDCSNLVSCKLKYSPNHFQNRFWDISVICSLGGSNQYVRYMKLSRLEMVNLIQLVLNAWWESHISV